MTVLGITPATVQIILTPVNIIIAAVLYCSFYPAYYSIFGANEDQSATQTTRG